MQRRELFKMAASTAGIALAASKTVEAKSTAKRAATPYIETADGTQIFHRDWGSGRPVVFIHGWAMNSDSWQYPMLELVNHGVRCIAHDTRGHGRSSDPGRGYDFDTFADDLSEVVSQLNLRDAVLVGHSMGAGQIVRYLARHGHSRIAGVVLAAPSGPFPMKTADNPDGVDKAKLDSARRAFCADFPKWLRVNAPGFFLPETSPEMVQWGINICLSASLQAVAEMNRMGVETDFRPELRKITTRTLILHGDRDLSAPLDFTGRRFAQLISGSELRVYEGAPHGLLMTHYQRVSQDILEFVKSLAT